MELEDGCRFDEMYYHGPSFAARNFTLGRHAEVDFVLQSHHRPVEGLPSPHEVCIEIRLGANSNRSVVPFGPCHFTHRE